MYDGQAYQHLNGNHYNVLESMNLVSELIDLPVREPMTWAEEVSLDTHGDVDDCTDENVKYFRGLIRCRNVTNEVNTEVVKEIYFYTSNLIVMSYSPREYPQRG
uniref:Uncharacterized protein n=1 Tax=Glossina palpalis gambiensis TaxID=67801 RepID=A0A1B0C3Z3_9MUSC